MAQVKPFVHHPSLLKSLTAASSAAADNANAMDSSESSKCIEPYRKRFFHANGEYATFLRKITHKVLDNQPKSGNIELLFNDQVQKNTQRLVDEYIRHFKNRESHQLQQHRTDSQGFSPK
uniref:Histone deacetylase complex subunit SAP30 n=1 Tax=Globodera pallida TaxID=36090 RepID=A0A183C2R9_GLOPA